MADDTDTKNTYPETTYSQPSLYSSGWLYLKWRMIPMLNKNELEKHAGNRTTFVSIRYTYVCTYIDLWGDCNVFVWFSSPLAPWILRFHWTDRQTDTQTDRQINRQMERPNCLTLPRTHAHDNKSLYALPPSPPPPQLKFLLLWSMYYNVDKYIHSTCMYKINGVNVSYKVCDNGWMSTLCGLDSFL